MTDYSTGELIVLAICAFWALLSAVVIVLALRAPLDEGQR